MMDAARCCGLACGYQCAPKKHVIELRACSSKWVASGMFEGRSELQGRDTASVQSQAQARTPRDVVHSGRMPFQATKADTANTGTASSGACSKLTHIRLVARNVAAGRPCDIQHQQPPCSAFRLDQADANIEHRCRRLTFVCLNSGSSRLAFTSPTVLRRTYAVCTAHDSHHISIAEPHNAGGQCCAQPLVLLLGVSGRIRPCQCTIECDKVSQLDTHRDPLVANAQVQRREQRQRQRPEGQHLQGTPQQCISLRASSKHLRSSCVPNAGR